MSNHGPVAGARPKGSPPENKMPQPMPRTKSSFDVSQGDYVPNPIHRNKSETSLEKQDTDSGQAVGKPMDRGIPPGPPSNPPAARTPSIQSIDEDSDQTAMSLPPPKSLPPSLPVEGGRGPPPPLPAHRPVSSVPVPAPRRDTKTNDGFMEGANITNQNSFDSLSFPGNQLSTAESIPKGNNVDDNLPNIPPRPRPVPTRPAPCPMPSPGSLPPAIPARAAPVFPNQSMAPQIPPRQGTSSWHSNTISAMNQESNSSTRFPACLSPIWFDPKFWRVWLQDDKIVEFSVPVD